MIRQTNRSTRSDAAFWKTARLELMARKIRGDGRGRRESESDVSDGHKAPKSEVSELRRLYIKRIIIASVGTM